MASSMIHMAVAKELNDKLKRERSLFETEKEQFEKYKEMKEKKIDIANKELEQKCDKFKEVIAQFNMRFKKISGE